jgi:cytochrome c2
MRTLLALLILTPCAAEAAEAADVHAEAKALMSAQCSACHTIPGVAGAYGDIGPSLKGIATHPQIAGKLPNSESNMVKWLMHPQQVSPGSAMPEMGLTSAQATRIAAYLATLDKP